MEKNVKKKGRLKMALFTFSGGVHPADGKEFAKNSPITEYLPKGDVVLPLGQHIGAPAQPIVSKGDQVLVGQKVAEAGGFVSANIFSSVSGTVKAVSYTHLRAHETDSYLVCRLLLEKKKKKK